MANRWFESLHVPNLWRRPAAPLSTSLQVLRANESTRLDLSDDAEIAQLPLRPGRTFPPDMPRPGNEYGATGTPNFGGFITGEDYNSKLDGAKALKVYEEMRRSDAQVRATLSILKLPLRAAQWDVDPPNGSTDPQDRAIADFCASALFDSDSMTQPWNYTLNHILLKLDYGVSVFEKVFTVGELGEIRYHRLAPRLPKTIFRWIVHPETGALEAVVQFAPKGGAYQYLTIPAQYAAVFCHEREGDNYFGRSVLRSAYQHWFYKTNAYRIDAVRLDRHGVGIPKAKIAQDHKATDAELTEIKKILRGMRTHERAYILEPYGVTFEIMTSKGDGGRSGAAGLIDSVNHHNFMMGVNILAGFLSAGEQRRGSTHQTQTLADIFQDALQAIADDTAGELVAQLVRPLCDLNFDMTGRKYPIVRASGVSSVDVPQIADAFNKLAPTKDNPTGFLTPDKPTQAWLRDLLGAPPPPEDAPDMTVPTGDAVPSAVGSKSARTSPAKSPAAASRLEPASDTPGDTGGNVTVEQPVAGGPGQQRPLRPRIPPPPGGASGGHPLGSDTAVGANDGYPLGLRKDPVMIDGRNYSRQPTPFEEQVFNLREIPNRLDYEREALVRKLSAIRQQQLSAVVRDLVTRDANPDTGAFTDLRPERTAMPLENDVYRAIRATQQALTKYGAEQIRSELQKQGAPVTLHGGRVNLAAGDASRPSTNKAIQTSTLVTSAKAAMKRINDAWQSTILEAAIRLRRTGLSGADFERDLLSELADTIDAGLSRVAGQEVNEAFAIGRAGEARLYGDLVDEITYSAVLDANTCDTCEELDGEVFDPNSPEWAAVDPPNPKCDGKDNCRCVGLYVFAGSREEAA